MGLLKKADFKNTSFDEALSLQQNVCLVVMCGSQ